MAVSTSTTFKKTHYSSDTPTPSISTGWMADSSDEVEVISIASSGAETTLTHSIHYTLSGLGVSTGFTVTMVGTISAGTDILVQPKTALTTDQNYSYQGSFSSSKTQSGYDSIVNMVKRVKNIADRAVKVPVGEVNDTPAVLPIASERASKAAAYDSNGDPTVVDIPTLGDDAIYVSTVAALRSYPSSDLVSGNIAWTKGYYSSSDRVGGPMWVWSSSSTDVDNGCTVIAANDSTGSGRWVRSFSGPFKASEAGCTGVTLDDNDFYIDTNKGIYGHATIIDGGSGYTDGQKYVAITGGGGSGAKAFVWVAGGVVRAAMAIGPGSGFTSDDADIDWSALAGGGTPGEISFSRVDGVCSYLNPHGYPVIRTSSYNPHGARTIIADWAGVTNDDATISSESITKLQRALDASGPGTTLKFRSGVYDCNTNKSVLQLNWRDMTVIGFGNGSTLMSLDFDVKNAGCKIIGLKLDGVFGAANHTDYGIRSDAWYDSFSVGSGNMSILNVFIRNKNSGILFASQTGTNTRISGCYITLCGNGSGAGGGIVFNPDSAGLDFADIHIADCTIYNNHDDGIQVNNCTTLLVDNCKILSNGRYGLGVISNGRRCGQLWVNNTSFEATGFGTVSDQRPSLTATSVTDLGSGNVRITCSGNHHINQDGTPLALSGFTPSGYNGNFTASNFSNNYTAGTCTFEADFGASFPGTPSVYGSVKFPGWDIFIDAGDDQIIDLASTFLFTGGDANYVMVKKGHSITFDGCLIKKVFASAQDIPNGGLVTTDPGYTNEDYVARNINYFGPSVGFNNNNNGDIASGYTRQTMTINWIGLDSGQPVGITGALSQDTNDGQLLLSNHKIEIATGSSDLGETDAVIVKRVTDQVAETKSDGEVRALNTAKVFGYIDATPSIVGNSSMGIASVAAGSSTGQVVVTFDANVSNDNYPVVIVNPIGVDEDYEVKVSAIEDGQCTIDGWDAGTLPRTRIAVPFSIVAYGRN